MSDLDLAAIKARCAAATEGPWLIESGDLCDNAGDWLGSLDGFYSIDDAEFVAAARTDVPALVAEVERLRSDLAECYRITGADPDGDDDAMLARKAVNAVKRLREESDTEAETADRRIEELEIGVREIAIMHQDDRPGIGEPSGDFDWRLRSEAQERVARSLLAKGGAA